MLINLLNTYTRKHIHACTHTYTNAHITEYLLMTVGTENTLKYQIKKVS